MYCEGGEREIGSGGIDVGVGKHVAAGIGVWVCGGCWCRVGWWPAVVEDADCKGTSGYGSNSDVTGVAVAAVSAWASRLDFTS